MKRSKGEAEVIVRLDFQEKKAHICVSQWPAIAAKMERIYGHGLDSAGGRTRRWVVPLKAISFRRPVSGARKPPRMASLPFSRRNNPHFPNPSLAAWPAGSTPGVGPQKGA